MVPYVELDVGRPHEICQGPGANELAQAGAEAFAAKFKLTLNRSSLTYRV